MKIARLALQTVAVVFILIGALHLEVHYRVLVPETSATLTQLADLDLGGITGNIYKMWQGFSFMMGVSFIIIGILVLVFMRKWSQQYPPIPILVIMMILQGAVIYSGYYFFAAPQLYGGMVGLAFLAVSLTLTLVGKE